MDGRRQDGVVIDLAAETGDVVVPLLSPACEDAPAGCAAPAVEEDQQPDLADGTAPGDDVKWKNLFFWLVMALLATFFMGMAFVAITNLPNWMPLDFGFKTRRILGFVVRILLIAIVACFGIRFLFKPAAN
jgi:hypothetical protein